MFSVQPKDGVGVLNRPLMLHCAVYDTTPQIRLLVNWEKENGGLAPGVHQMANGSLFFSWLKEEDLGRYVCSARKESKQIRSVVTVSKACMYHQIETCTRKYHLFAVCTVSCVCKIFLIHQFSKPFKLCFLYVM